MTLAVEMRRLGRDTRYMTGSSGHDDIGSEAPNRIHSRDVDGGGSPEWHPHFERWLADSGVCFCPVPTEEDSRAHRYPCSYIHARLQMPTNRAHPRRLKRAFRQLRDIDPAAYDIVWLLIGRRMSWPDVIAKINDERTRRGQGVYADHELAALAIGGVSLLSAAF
jgi:hypothetical protein